MEEGIAVGYRLPNGRRPSPSVYRPWRPPFGRPYGWLPYLRHSLDKLPITNAKLSNTNAIRLITSSLPLHHAPLRSDDEGAQLLLLRTSPFFLPFRLSCDWSQTTGTSRKGTTEGGRARYTLYINNARKRARFGGGGEQNGGERKKNRIFNIENLAALKLYM